MGEHNGDHGDAAEWTTDGPEVCSCTGAQPAVHCVGLQKHWATKDHQRRVLASRTIIAMNRRTETKHHAPLDTHSSLCQSQRQRKASRSCRMDDSHAGGGHLRNGTAGETLLWAAKEMDDTTTSATSTGVDKDQCCKQTTGSTEAPVAPRQKDYDRNEQPAGGDTHGSSCMAVTHSSICLRPAARLRLETMSSRTTRHHRRRMQACIP